MGAANIFLAKESVLNMEERNAADIKGVASIVNSQFCVKHGVLGKL
jgi:hypothetical protein